MLVAKYTKTGKTDFLDDMLELLIGLIKPIEFLYAIGQYINNYSSKNNKSKV